MNSAIENMKPRDMWMGLFKLTILMTVGLLGAAALLTGIFDIGGGKLSPITINALLLAVAVTIFATGIRTTLSIFDWFESRRLKRGQNNG